MAGVYNSSFPITAAASNAIGASMETKAPPILAGTPRSIADVTNAVMEERSRKHAKYSKDATITDDEIAYSVTRTVAVATEYAQGIYGGGVGAPVWAQALLALPAQIQPLLALPAQIQPLLALPAQIQPLLALPAQVQNLQETVNDLQETVEDLQETVKTIEARQRCGIACRRNALKIRVNKFDNFDQLCKVRAGVGPPTPGQPATQGMAAAAVGTQYPNHLAPANQQAIGDMTLAAISRLAEWANEDFGIVDNDNVAMRRVKLAGHYIAE